MKKIQLISYVSFNLRNYDNFLEVSTLSNPISFDNYDVNIIDFSNTNMWSSYFNTNDTITNDIKNLNSMLTNNTKSVVIVVFPQNITVGQYKSEAKNYLGTIKEKIRNLTFLNNYNCFYENSEVKIGDETCMASFAFDSNDYEKILFTNNTNKAVAIRNENIIITSANIINNLNTNLLYKFLKDIGIINLKEEIPEWVYKYQFYNDEELSSNIEVSKERIKEEKEKIGEYQKRANENLGYKKLLYSNGEELVEQVFKILENIFEISLENFEDDKREDFLFRKNDITFIGEIKGVTSNVKSEHISQLNVHVSKYNDKLQEQLKEEKVLALLIINFERNKPLDKRNEIHNNQLELANKLDILIVDTFNLLKLFEKVLKGEISRKDAVSKIISSKGLLEIY